MEIFLRLKEKVNLLFQISIKPIILQLEIFFKGSKLKQIAFDLLNNSKNLIYYMFRCLFNIIITFNIMNYKI